MIYRDLNKKIKYFENKTIKDILADFYLLAENEENKKLEE